MQQRKTQRSMAVWECYCSFHFVVEVKVSCIYVERNTAFRYAYYFICTCCVFHINLTIAVGNGCHLSKVLRPWLHSGAQARRRETLQVSKDSRAVCSLNYGTYVTTYSYVIFVICVHMPYNPFSVPNRVHKLPHTDCCVITEWVSFITIGVANFFSWHCTVFKYDKFGTQFVFNHALSILSVHYWGLHMHEQCFILRL